MAESNLVNPTAYPALSDADLLKLIFTEEDHLPLEFATEAVSRGKRLVPALVKILLAEKNWTAGSPAWWAVVHSALLLGAIGGEAAVEPLTQAIFYGSRYDVDWVTEELPSIFGSLGPAAVQPLKDLAADRSWDWYIRTRAMCGLAAITIKHPQYDEEVFTFIAAIVAAGDEDEDTPGHAALILLDFLREEYRGLLISAAPAADRPRIYDAEDVNRDFLKGKKDLYWYTRDWLDFYSPEKVSERTRRWREEAKKTHEDDFEDREQPLISRSAALEHLGPRAALASKVRENIGLTERGLAKPDLKTQYDLAMKTQLALAAMFDEDDDRIDALQEQLKAPPPSTGEATRKAAVNRLDPFTIFDVAVGSGRLVEWLVKLTFKLGDEGMAREAAELCEAWGEITDPEIFLANKGLMLAKAGLRDEAHAQIKTNLGFYDYDMWVNIKAGATFEELENLSAAEVLYRKALDLSGGNVSDREDALEYLIPLLRKLGKNEEADRLITELQPEPLWEPPPWPETVKRESPKTGRNEPCPCGSGKKHKKCCLGAESDGQNNAKTNSR